MTVPSRHVIIGAMRPANADASAHRTRVVRVGVPARSRHPHVGKERIPLLAERLGSDRAVKVTFFTHTGDARLRSVDGSRSPSIVRREATYYNMRPSARFLNEEPIIF